MPDQTITIRGRRPPEEASVSADSIRYLPFDMPPGVTRLSLTLDFEEGPGPDDRGTVDLGLFDPRGYEFGGPGFRGWQGGTRRAASVTGDKATTAPWYVPGPLPAGRWHLAQWFLRSAPAGLGYTYTVTLGFDDPAPPPALPDVPAYDPGVLDPAPGWYAAGLHNHTVHSDGGLSLADMVTHQASTGHRIVACTDHNSVRGHYHFAETARQRPDMLLLFGSEITSAYGHANVLGQRPGFWYDFRMDGGDGRLPLLIDEAHEQGALVVINHPFSGCTTCAWRYPADEWRGADAIEVWNGRFKPDDRQAVDWWDAMLKAGRRLPAIGGADFHNLGDRLTPTAWLHCQNLSRPAVLEAIQRGRSFLSESPHGPKLYLTAGDGRALPGDTIRPQNGRPAPVQAHVLGGAGLTLRMVWNDGETHLPVPSDDAALPFDVPLNGASAFGYVRAELLRPDGVVAALTNPIFLER